MPDLPGFEAVFAIAGLLAVAYLVLRKTPKRPTSMSMFLAVLMTMILTVTLMLIVLVVPVCAAMEAIVMGSTMVAPVVTVSMGIIIAVIASTLMTLLMLPEAGPPAPVIGGAFFPPALNGNPVLNGRTNHGQTESSIIDRISRTKSHTESCTESYGA